MNGLISGIGLMAGTLTTISFIPQVLRIWRTRSGKDVSGHMFVIFSLGVALWLIYGICLRDYPIIISNAVTLALSGSVLFLKFKYSL